MKVHSGLDPFSIRRLVLKQAIGAGAMPRTNGLIVLTLVALMTAPSSSAVIPPPPDAVAADCQHPIYATDTLVCSTPNLRAQNEEMRALLARTAPGDLLGRPPFLESQDEWLRRRSMCAAQSDYLTCTNAAYTERLTVLRAFREAKPRGARVMACTPTRWAVSILPSGPDGAVVLFDAIGAVRAVALAQPAPGSWQPFVSARRAGRSWTFQAASGIAMRCR